MTETDTQMHRLRERAQVLSRRVDVLESLLLRSYLGLTIALVAIGSVRWAVHNPDAAVERWSVVSAPFRYIHYLRNDVPREDVVATLAVIGAATVLLLCVLVAVGLCLTLWGREVGERTSGVARSVAVVLLVGAAVVILTGLVGGAGVDEAGIGPGAWWLSAGAALFALLSFHEDLQRLWLR